MSDRPLTFTTPPDPGNDAGRASANDPESLGPSGEIPPALSAAWQALADGRRLVAFREVSAQVSTNRVYEITLDDGHCLIAKISSYGSYVHFRQDHQLIDQWSNRLRGRHARFLAPIVKRGDEVFIYRHGHEWLAFYEKVPFYDFLPRVLSEGQVSALGSEMAHFHRASYRASRGLTPSWKSVGADVATLHAVAGSAAWRARRELPDEAENVIRQHCESFLINAENLGFHSMPRIPVLVDWNTGNFSVGLDQTGFKFFSRWDFDWFRVDPRTFDFYFCARVVREAGDRTEFTYHAEPLFEPRFERFLSAYHAVSPLEARDLLFLKEVYRFFLLVYVMHSGEHFFRPSYRRRLQREVMETHLPRVDALDFRPLAERVLG